MAIKSVIISDISSTEVPDDQHVRIVVEHPDVAFPVELDVSAEEADKLQNTNLRLVNFTIYAPNVPPRKALVETKTLDKLYGSVDFDKVLEGARKAEVPAARPAAGRPRKAAAAPKSGGTDYTAPDRYGQLHRGRITDEEARLVREGRDTASKNREAQTGNPIDFNDPKEKARYKL